jgi:PPE-repeat protein
MREHHRGCEVLDVDPETGVDPDLNRQEWAGSAVASDYGAGAQGFAGTARKQAAAAAGLTTLAADEFGDGPALPMVPSTWESDPRDPDNLC